MPQNGTFGLKILHKALDLFVYNSIKYGKEQRADKEAL